MAHPVAVGELRRPLHDRQLSVLGGSAFTAAQFLDPVLARCLALSHVLLERFAPRPAEPSTGHVDQGTDPVRVVQRVPEGEGGAPRVPQYRHLAEAEMSTNGVEVSGRLGEAVGTAAFRAPASALIPADRLDMISQQRGESAEHVPQPPGRHDTTPAARRARYGPPKAGSRRWQGRCSQPFSPSQYPRPQWPCGCWRVRYRIPSEPGPTAAAGREAVL